MMMMMIMTMTTKYRIKHSVICLCQSAVVVVVVVLLIIMWWWWDVNDHHHMYRVLWRIYSRSFSYQGRVIAPTLFGIFSSLLLSYPFDSSTDGVYLHTSTEGKLFNLARLCAKTKVKTVFVSEMLFADNAYRGNIAEAHQPIRQRMWKLWPLNQAQENQCECLGCQPSPWNQNRRPHSRGSWQIHLPRFHRLHEHKQNSEISQRATGTMSKLTKRAWGNKYLTERTWQWNLDHLHKTETPLEHFLSAMSQAHPRRQVARPHHQQWNAVTCWNPKHVLHSQSAPPEMARAYSSHGWWTHLQGRPILTIDDRSQASRAPCSAVQGREQTWPQSMRNSSKQLRRCRVSSCLLETVKEWSN